jgi:signal transduction histidine kinase
MQPIADRDLNERSKLGAIIYTIAWFLIVSFTSIEEVSPEIAYGIGGWLIIMSCVRLLMSVTFHPLYQRSPALWRALFLISLIVSAGPFSFFCAWTVMHSSLGLHAMITLLPLIMIAAGGVYSLTPNRIFFVIFTLILLGPQMYIFLPGQVNESYEIFIMLVVYTTFVLSVSRNATHDYIALLAEKQKEHARAVELKMAMDEVASASKAKSEFLSKMSHELRTPMNAILGFSQVLEVSDDISHDDRDSAKQIKLAGEYLLGLINNVLDLAKIDSGRLSLKLEEVNLSQIVDECIKLVANVDKEKQIIINKNIPVETLIHADASRIKQVIFNLLENAIEYNVSHGEINIFTTEPVLEDHIKLNVVDTGKGISEDRLPNLFHAFDRIDIEHQDTEGAGVGLAIAAGLVNLMGGRIGASSIVGEGSTFWVELPAAPSDSLSSL